MESKHCNTIYNKSHTLLLHIPLRKTQMFLKSSINTLHPYSFSKGQQWTTLTLMPFYSPPLPHTRTHAHKHTQAHVVSPYSQSRRALVAPSLSSLNVSFYTLTHKRFPRYVSLTYHMTAHTLWLGERGWHYGRVPSTCSEEEEEEKRGGEGGGGGVKQEQRREEWTDSWGEKGRWGEGVNRGGVAVRKHCFSVLFHRHFVLHLSFSSFFSLIISCAPFLWISPFFVIPIISPTSIISLTHPSIFLSCTVPLLFFTLAVVKMV